MLALHEGPVVGLATGWALAREQPAFALLHTTAGLGNAVGALATARVNRAPLVVLVGQQDRRHLALEPFLAGGSRSRRGYPVWVDQPVRAAGRPRRDPPRLARSGDPPWAGDRDRPDGRLGRRCRRGARARRARAGPPGGPRRPGGGGRARRLPRRRPRACARGRRRHRQRRGLGGARPSWPSGSVRPSSRSRSAPAPASRRTIGSSAASSCRPAAPARKARAVRRASRRRRAGLPPVAVRAGTLIEARHPDRGRRRQPGRGAPEPGGARGARAARGDLPRARRARVAARDAAPQPFRPPPAPSRPLPGSHSRPVTSSPRSPSDSHARRSSSRRRPSTGLSCTTGSSRASRSAT